jgi:hypothetical protein
VVVEKEGIYSGGRRDRGRVRGEEIKREKRNMGKEKEG